MARPHTNQRILLPADLKASDDPVTGRLGGPAEAWSVRHLLQSTPGALRGSTASVRYGCWTAVRARRLLTRIRPARSSPAPASKTNPLQKTTAGTSPHGS